MSFNVHRLDDRAEGEPKRWESFLAVFLKIGRPFARLWNVAKARHMEEHERKERSVSVLKRVFMILVSVLLALLLLAGVVRALVALRIVNLHTFLSVTAADLPVDERGMTNILLLGSGDASHEGVDLTDTIMVTSIDPENTQSALMLSIPRDLYVLETEKMGEGRINSLYRDYKNFLKRTEDMEEDDAAKEALAELGREVGRNLAMPIHGVVKIDFIGFVQAVDELGGVDVVVPEDIVDPEYPGPNYTYETFSIKAGQQHLDGETALKYARSRHTTSDFSRSERQQQIIQALGDKARNEGLLSSPSTLISLIGIISEHFATTLGSRELLGLAEAGMDLDSSKVINLQLNNSNGLYNSVAMPAGLLYAPPRDFFQGASVLLPVSIPENPVTWKQIQLLIRLLQEHRAIYAQKPVLHVLNAGADSGLARRLASELTRFGFNVTEVANADGEDLPTSSVTAADPALARFFADLLKMDGPAADAKAEVSVPPKDVTILVGEDYEYEPLQSLVP